MTKKKLPDDYIGGLMSNTAPETETPTDKKPIKPAPEETAKEKARRERLTVYISADVVDKARDAVYFEPGVTLTSLVQDAVTREIKRLEKKRGEEYPKRKGKITTGRPVK